MSQQTTDNRPAVENLAAGDHISDNTGVHQVVHVLRYNNGDGTPMIALTQLPLGKGEPWVARHAEGTKLHLATDAEVRDYTDAGRRAALAEALHNLADDIVEQRLPVSASLFDVGPGVLGSRADLERWAAYVGVEVTLSGRIPIASTSRPIADGLSLHFHTQCSPEPEPVVVDPTAGAELAAKVQGEADALPAEV
ncbi:hypothetical protein [Micromonospora sp. NPDC047730]|uniref:hypothetical protein n=1 Tax=Micromonospora sp. NPDC047730 TaxID=3364253 RepID=UPI0037114990